MLVGTNDAHNEHVAACISIGRRHLAQTVTLQNNSLIITLVCTSWLPNNGRQKKTTKAKCVVDWRRDFETGTQPLHISAEILKTVIKKLKPGKGSSDGVTAEILRELDESNLEAMAAAINNLFLRSELPQTWSEITATLVPKLAVPSGPKDFRPIAA